MTWASDHLEWTDQTPEGSGERGGLFENITCAAGISDAAKAKLQALCLFKYDATPGAYKGNILNMNLDIYEGMCFSGGCMDVGSSTGVFFFYGCFLRPTAGLFLGFRSAYVEL